MHARSSKPGSGPRGVAAWRARAVGLVLAGLWLPAHADALWQFVDRDGVLHMGNVAAPQAPAGRELIWLSLPPGAARDAPAARKARAGSLRSSACAPFCLLSFSPSAPSTSGVCR